MSQYSPLQGGIAGLGQLGATSPLARGQVFNPFAMPADPFLGGNLGIGRTGLQGLGQLPGMGQLPFARGINGLAGQVPMGVGSNALTAANALRPAGAMAEAAGGAGGLLSRLPSMPKLNPGSLGMG